MARYQAAVKPWFQAQLATMTDLPRYEISATLQPDADRLQGELRLHLTNTSPDPWRTLVFRLYPALIQYGGGADDTMVVQRALVNGQVINPTYLAHNTAIELLLPEILRAGDTVEVELHWLVKFPEWQKEEENYVLFGKRQQMISLPLFYPSLAVYEPLRGARPGQWWTTEGIVRGDAAFNPISLFDVTLTMPADQAPVTSGTLITSTFINEQQARHVWVTGPSREFLLHTSPQFRSAYTEAYGTRVTSYWLPGQEATGHAALTYAVAALRIYSDRFGPYPFRDLRVAPAPLSYRGMEYPQASLIGVDLYANDLEDLEILVAHEVAHQWWYQIVHNDPVKEPWLDEALAEYSVHLYFEDLYSQKRAAVYQDRRWQLPLDSLKSQKYDTAIDQPVNDFLNGAQYETVIYGKGALFYASLRQALGDYRFKRFLRTYFQTHQYQIVTTDDWLAAIHTLNNPALDVLYEEWVKPPALLPPAAVSPTLTPLPLPTNGQK
ncbi:MAG: M1 family metallopeptidase [Caldilineaceae bacterium]